MSDTLNRFDTEPETDIDVDALLEALPTLTRDEMMAASRELGLDLNHTDDAENMRHRFSEAIALIHGKTSTNVTHSPAAFDDFVSAGAPTPHLVIEKETPLENTPSTNGDDAGNANGESTGNDTGVGSPQLLENGNVEDDSTGDDVPSVDAQRKGKGADSTVYSEVDKILKIAKMYWVNPHTGHRVLHGAVDTDYRQNVNGYSIYVAPANPMHVHYNATGE